MHHINNQTANQLDNQRCKQASKLTNNNPCDTVVQSDRQIHTTKQTNTQKQTAALINKQQTGQQMKIEE